MRTSRHSRRAKPARRSPRSSWPSKWLTAALAVGFVILLGASIYVSSQSHATLPASEVPLQKATPFPGAAATVTAVRRLPTLSSEEALPYEEIGVLVRACDELHPNRQQAVLQHLAWLMHPNTAPTELISLYGDQWRAKIAFGAAYLAAVDWKAAGRKSDSCLIPIGTRLNAILAEMGEKPIAEFQQVAGTH